MQDPRLKIVFDNTNRSPCTGKAPKHPKRMIGSAPGHTCAHNLG